MIRLSRLSLVVTAVLLVSGAAMAMPSGTDRATAGDHAQTRVQLSETRFIRGGCPYNLDKVCTRHFGGKWHCHCQS